MQQKISMKNQLQGAASSMINNQPEQQNYDDLKKKLLNEYKKLSKEEKKDGNSDHWKHQQQIEQTLQSSANAMNTAVSGNEGSMGSQTNLNNSTASAHLNVYKPTFIINNSFQPGGQEEHKDGRHSGKRPEQSKNQNT